MFRLRKVPDDVVGDKHAAAVWQETLNMKSTGLSSILPYCLQGTDTICHIPYVCIQATLQNILVVQVYSEDFNLDVGLFKSYRKPYKTIFLNKHKHTLYDFRNGLFLRLLTNFF